MSANPSSLSPPTRIWNKNYFLLWQGQFVSLIGSQAFSIGMVFWLKHTTESARVIGWIMMAASIPSIVLSPFGGTIADYFSRKKILIFCDLLSGSFMLGLTFVFYLDPQNTDRILTCIFITAIVAGIGSSLFRPAVAASIPEIVPKHKLDGANSLNQMSIQIANIFGQLLGGVLYRFFGPLLLFFINGISSLFSAVSEGFIHIPQVFPERIKGGFKPVMVRFFRDTLDGLLYLWKRPGMKNLFLGSMVLNFFFSPFSVLFPFYVEDFLKKGPDWYSYLLASVTVGTMVGLTVIGVLKPSGKLRKYLLMAALPALSLCFLSLGLFPNPYIALLLMLLMGSIASIFNVSLMTVFQLTTPTEIRGRVFGVMGTMTGGLVPISIGLAGIVLDLLDKNVLLIYLFCGTMVFLVAVALGFNKNYRDFLATEAPKRAAVSKETPAVAEPEPANPAEPPA